jgi:hypothetical protein
LSFSNDIFRRKYLPLYKGGAGAANVKLPPQYWERLQNMGFREGPVLVLRRSSTCDPCAFLYEVIIFWKDLLSSEKLFFFSQCPVLCITPGRFPGFLVP